MIYLQVILTVKDDADVATVGELLEEQARRSREEPGCVRFEVYQSREDPRVYILSERWESQEDLDRHREAAAFTELYVPRVIPLVDRTPHPSNLISGE